MPHHHSESEKSANEWSLSSDPIAKFLRWKICRGYVGVQGGLKGGKSGHKQISEIFEGSRDLLFFSKIYEWIAKTHIYLFENVNFPFKFVKCACFPNLMIDTVSNSQILMPNPPSIQS